MSDENPHSPETPEWQLYENMVSNEAQARARAADAGRLQLKSQAARAKAQLYRDALAKLTAKEGIG